MLFLLFYTLIIALVTPTWCSIQVSLALDEQLPLVARVQKPYSWTFSAQTFLGSTSESIKYSTSNLPAWLSFDADQRKFSGIPKTEHAGNTVITVSGSQGGSVARSSFVLCVVSSAAPQIELPLSVQLTPPRPSLSSVFSLSDFSALATGHPALRIPPRWSFSIGFELETLRCEEDVFYDVRQSDGSYLPLWMTFNYKELTLNGVVPNETILSKPTTFALSLFASDVQGYSAEALPFDIVIASHEVSMKTASLPTINVQQSTEFHVSLKDSVDFSGLLVDGKPINSTDITGLSLDTKLYSWLWYDQSGQTLVGTLPQDHAVHDIVSLPLTIDTIYDQRIHTALEIAAMSSSAIFVQSHIPALQSSLDGLIDFSLRQFFTNNTDVEQLDVLTAFDPMDCSRWLGYDSKTSRLTGHVPADFSGTQVNVTFMVQSRNTHISDNAQLTINLSRSARPNNGVAKSNHDKLSPEKHRRLVLGLSIAFGLVGGFGILGVLLAFVRRCARVPDTALSAEEGGQMAWSEGDKQWYGLPEQESDSSLTTKAQPLPYDTLDLRRVSERSQAQLHDESQNFSFQSPGVMIKKNFKKGLQRTIRMVSNHGQGSTGSRERPMISRPFIPPRDSASEMLAAAGIYGSTTPGLLSTPASTIITDSPSASTGGHSVAVRRPDFAAPRRHRQSTTKRISLQRQNSTESAMSVRTEDSVGAHAEEAVVQTASRARSASGSLGQVKRPYENARLVNFVGASPVPIPQDPEDYTPETQTPSGPHRIKRVPSQKATVYRKGLDSPKNAQTPATTPSPHRPNLSKDKMSLRIKPGEPFRMVINLLPLDPDVKEKAICCRRPRGASGLVPSYVNLDTRSLGTTGAVQLHGKAPSNESGTFVVEVGEEDGPPLVTVTVEAMHWR